MSLPDADCRHGQWLRAIAERRDRAAFAALFLDFAPRLKAWLVRAGARPDLAEDMAQETMLAVWHKAALYDPARATAAAWIFTILRNRHIDQVRGTRARTEADFPPPPVSPAACPAPTQDAVLIAAERAARLHAALRTLPPDQRAALHLAYFEACSHTEMGKALGVPLGTVKSRLRLAMAKLRLALAEDEDEAAP